VRKLCPDDQELRDGVGARWPALIDLDLVEPARVDGRVSEDRVRPAVLDRG
jgi:hypothetical protein